MISVERIERADRLLAQQGIAFQDPLRAVLRAELKAVSALELSAPAESLDGRRANLDQSPLLLHDELSPALGTTLALYNLYDQIARAFELVGELTDAAFWYCIAGQRADEQVATEEALTSYARALGLLDAAALTTSGGQPDPQPLAIRYDIHTAREKLYDRLGQRDQQRRELNSLQWLAAHIPDGMNPRRKAEFSARLALFYYRTSDFAAASLAARETVMLAREASALDLEATGYLRWGQVLTRQADQSAARPHFEQALSLAKMARFPDLEAECLRNLGWLTNMQGNYVAAHAYYEQALAIFKQTGSLAGQAGVLNNLGIIARERGDHRTAQLYYRDSMALWQQVGDKIGESTAISNLANNTRALGEYTEAATYFDEALRLKREIGDRSGASVVVLNMGINARDCGDLVAAKAHFEQALRLFRELGNRREESSALVNLSLVYHYIGDQNAARQYSQQAQLIAQEVEARREQTYALIFSGHAFAAQGRLNAATAAYQDALRLETALNDRSLKLDSLAGLARVALGQGRLEAAHQYVSEMLQYIKLDELPAEKDDPFRVYLTCMDVLRAVSDPRAEAVLKMACATLNYRLEKLPDDKARQLYLAHPAGHGKLYAMCTESGDTPSA